MRGQQVRRCGIELAHGLAASSRDIERNCLGGIRPKLAPGKEGFGRPPPGPGESRRQDAPRRASRGRPCVIFREGQSGAPAPGRPILAPLAGPGPLAAELEAPIAGTAESHCAILARNSAARARSARRSSLRGPMLGRGGFSRASIGIAAASFAFAFSCSFRRCALRAALACRWAALSAMGFPLKLRSRAPHRAIRCHLAASTPHRRRARAPRPDLSTGLLFGLNLEQMFQPEIPT
jgi:hypothetical protein